MNSSVKQRPILLIFGKEHQHCCRKWPNYDFCISQSSKMGKIIVVYVKFLLDVAWKKSLKSSNVSKSYSKNKSDFPHLFPKKHNWGQIDKTSNLQLTTAKHSNNKLQDSSKIHWVIPHNTWCPYNTRPKWAVKQQQHFNNSIDIPDVFQDSDNLVKFLIASEHLPPHIGSARRARNRHSNNNLMPRSTLVDFLWRAIHALKQLTNDGPYWIEHIKHILIQSAEYRQAARTCRSYWLHIAHQACVLVSRQILLSTTREKGTFSTAVSGKSDTRTSA